QVVRAARIPVVALGMSVELVTSSDPVPFDGVLGPLVFVPVVGAGAVALDQQVAYRSVRHIRARLVNDPRLVSRHKLAARPGADPAGPIGDEDMEDLRAADAVENLPTETILEPLVKGLRERLTRRHGVPDARKIEVLSLLLMGQQLPVIGRHREEQRWLESLDLRLDVGRRRRPRPEDGGRANRKGKGQRVSKAVGKEQLGQRKGPIRGGDPEDALRVARHGMDDVVMQVYGALRKSGGAGRVEPERRVVLAGLFDLEPR